MAVEFRLLGSVEARVDGRLVDLGPARQRCGLAALLADANQAVPVDQLMDRVWADRPPQRARQVLYSYLSRLRRILAGAGDVRIGWQAGGYLLTVDAMAVDLHRFGHLLGQARAADDDQAAVEMLDEALRLWRGPAFATLDTPWLTSVRHALDKQRLAAELDHNDLALRLGRHTALLADLSAAAAAHPLDERLAGQLMLALYRSGRQADALAHYRQMRLRLADELGADPSPPLQHLHQQILKSDPALAAPAAITRPIAKAPGAPVPRQLPAAARSFTGRADQLTQLDALLETAGEQPTAVVISAIAGTAGVGKTALAVHWAHRAADRFPDGQLYVNLRGFDPAGIATTPADAIRGFLDALAVPRHRIPVDLDAQAGLYRSLLAGRRMLVVLDNARDADQVRLLLPGTPGCLVLVTSRNQLSSLVAADGAHPLTLDLLTPDEARQLLARRLGADRVAAESAAVNDIITACARLPLALTIVAARAATHPHFPLHTLASELHDRLDALTDTDPATDVRAVFSWSYQQLSTDAARLFRLLGLHPGPDIAATAAASLAGLPPPQVRPLLAELARTHLIIEHTPGRYAFHDLLRAYATEQTHTHDTDTDRHTAIGRMLDHYLSSAAAATATLHPATQHQTLGISAPATADPSVADPTAAQAWLDAERANLVAAGAYAADHDWTAHSIRLARVLARYLDTAGHYAHAVTLHTHARNASRRIGDHAGEAQALTSLGLVHRRRGELGLAVEHLHHALTLSRRVGDRATEAVALTILGAVYWARGELGPAAEQLDHALTLSRQVGDQSTEAWALTMLGAVSFRQGELGPAAEQLNHALTLCRQVGDHADEARALAFLGSVSWSRGELGPAAEQLDHALTLCRQVGNRADEAWALAYRGAVSWRRGELGPAAEQLHHALTLCRQVGDPAGEALTLAMLGGVFWRRGELGPAAEHLHHALTLYRQVGNRADEAFTLAMLGGVYWRRGELAPAAEQLDRALTLCRQVGNPAIEGMTLAMLGGVYWRRGELAPAAEQLDHALTLCRQVGDRATEASALAMLGLVYGYQGDHDRAAEHLERALALSRQVGDRATEADAMTALGLVCARRGEPELAVEYLQQALTLCRQLGYRAGEADALNGLGEAFGTSGSMHQSRIQHTRALAVAIEIGNRDAQAHAHQRIAITHQATGDLDQARQHWQHALTLYTGLDLPEAHAVLAHLSGLD
jgi:DNA-binding SARP family transcriptional activator/Tfp pilus assembly protein PilF